MYQIDFRQPLHVFFVGIGGISMSGLARILADKGFTVSGSDRQASEITRELEISGIRVLIGQRRENITDDIDLVVFTAAIHPDNPEYMAVMEKGIPSMTRAELLGQLMKTYQLPVAVSGTHGKTTTTSMLSEILMAADVDPTLSIGGILPSIGGNIRVGGNRYFVAEACEYTNSFLHMFPQIAIILNIEEDHLDFFKDLAEIRSSFRRFAALLPENGALIINADIENWQEIAEGLPCAVIPFRAGIPGPEEAPADPGLYYASDVSFDDSGYPSFTLHGPAEYGSGTRISLHVHGVHNIGNAIAAVAAADRLGISREASVKGLAAFTGADRRFQYRGERNGFTIMDDYAHHPTEIETTLSAARFCPHDRIIAVFQPHTYSRTKALLKGFARALSKADLVILADIYPARETDTLGVSSEDLREEILRLGGNCVFLPTFEEIEKYLLANCRKNDLVITIGAGNIDQVGTNLLS